MRYFLAIILPPLAVLLCGKPIQFLLNIVLTLLFWLPGVVHALLVVNEKMDDDLVYQMTAALWSNRMLALFKAGHALGQSITPETALVGISIAIHPGAERYYQEHPLRFRGSKKDAE